MTRAKGKTGSSEQFARRKRFDGDTSERRNPVVYVVCALVGCVYSLPVRTKTLRYASLGAGVGAIGGIALSGAGTYSSRLLALDATAVGTVAVAVGSLVVWLWYLGSLARGNHEGSPTWVVWLFSGGYVTLMIILLFVLAAPIFG
jgi:hypothetical protein